MGLHYTMHLVCVLLVMTLLTEVRQFLTCNKQLLYVHRAHVAVF